MKRIFILALVIIYSVSTYSQGYEIKVQINGLSDEEIYLGYHLGKNTYSIDTTRVDNKGYGVFTGDRQLERGIYWIAIPSRNMNFFDFLIADSQKFSMETNVNDFYSNFKVSGSKDNELFRDYQLKRIDFQKQYNDLVREYELIKGNIAEENKINEKLNNYNSEIQEYFNSVISSNPESLLAKILNTMKEVEVPDPPKDINGNIIDPSFQYLYLKEHYFDYVDFSEGGLVRTPFYQNKLNYYFSKLVVPSPDSLIKETSLIINKAFEGGDSVMFRYTLGYLLNSYDTSTMMGYDAVFVAIAEDWYLNGKAPWVDSTVLELISEKVRKITPNMLGNIAPDLLRLGSIDDRFYSLHQLKGDFTVLIFYEPNCGFCKIEIPKLMNEYRNTLKDMNVNVFAVYTQYDRKEWAEFIDDQDLNEQGWYNVWDGPYPHSGFMDYYDVYNTPVIFILDKDKKIIGKRIGAENIKNLIELYNKRQEQ